jgi:hypothetical protein
MKTLSLKRAAAWSLLSLLGVGCGSVTIDKSSSNASGSGSGSGSATGAGGASSASASASSGGDVGGGIGFGGFPAMSSSDVGAGGSPDMPALFDCFGCLCDGATHFCELFTGGGPTPPPGPPPEPTCPEDNAPNRCKPIPAACSPMATCQCVSPQMGGCTCDVNHQGITVVCVLP